MAEHDDLSAAGYVMPCRPATEHNERAVRLAVKRAFAEAWCSTEHEYHVAGDAQPCRVAKGVSGLDPVVSDNGLMDAFLLQLSVAGLSIVPTPAERAARVERARARKAVAP